MAFPWLACNLLRISAVAAENCGKDGPEALEAEAMVFWEAHGKGGMGILGVVCAVDVDVDVETMG